MRHRRSCLSDGPAARPGVPGRVPDPVRGLVVPQRVGQGLPQRPASGRAGDRPLRGDDGGIQAVHAFRREPRNQEIFETSTTATGRPTKRSGCSRSSCPASSWSATSPSRGALVRRWRLHGEMTMSASWPRSCSTCGSSSSRCRRSEPVLQPVPVRGAPLEKLSGVLEERRPSVPTRSTRSPLPDRGARSSSTMWQFSYRTAPVLPHLDLDRPRRARPSRWSGPPAPARPRSPSWWRASTTRRWVGDCSTASTCATSPRATCGAPSSW